jgi:hypothetical protein
MFEFVNSLRCMLQASLMALIIATCVERVLAADGAGQPPNPQASGYGRGLVGMSQTPLVPPPMNETPQNIKPPPAIQQLCGITSVPHEPSNLVGVLGPVRYERISTGRLAYIRRVKLYVILWVPFPFKKVDMYIKSNVPSLIELSCRFLK